MRNHSATHLLHAALRELLGDHIQQKGSLVNEHYLRFDFSHPKAVTPDEIRQLELRVNQQVVANAPVGTELMDIEQAKASGAMALFGEKYDAKVRVLTMGEDNFSRELCGGTHVNATGDIGLFRIVSEGAVASGVRRIEAVTGLVALQTVQQQGDTLHQLGELLHAHPADLAKKVEQQNKKLRDQEKQIEQLQQKLASGSGNDLLDQVEEVKGVKLLVARLDGTQTKVLRTTLDKLKDKLGSGVILLAAVQEDGKVGLIAGVTKDLTDRVKAGDLLGKVAADIDGKGGGRPDMAQGGGTNVTELPAALKKVSNWLAERLDS